MGCPAKEGLTDGGDAVTGRRVGTYLPAGAHAQGGWAYLADGNIGSFRPMHGGLTRKKWGDGLAVRRAALTNKRRGSLQEPIPLVIGLKHGRTPGLGALLTKHNASA
jgi:hypothetical protein